MDPNSSSHSESSEMEDTASSRVKAFDPGYLGDTETSPSPPSKWTVLQNLLNAVPSTLHVETESSQSMADSKSGSDSSRERFLDDVMGENLLSSEQNAFFDALPDHVRLEYGFDILMCLNSYNGGGIGVVDLELQIMKTMIITYPEQAEGFKGVLPKSIMVSKGVPNGHILDEVREALYPPGDRDRDKISRYIDYLKIFKKHIEGSMSTEKFKNQASPYLADHPDLYNQFQNSDEERPSYPVGRKFCEKTVVWPLLRATENECN